MYGMYGMYGGGEGMRLALQDGLAGGGVTFLLFMLVLAVFIALAGFVSYAILKAMGRQKFMWIAIPVLSVVFCGLLLICGRVSFGRKPPVFIFTSTNVSGGVSLSNRTLGFIAPVMGQYKLSVSDVEMLFPQNTISYDYYMQPETQVKQPISAIVKADSAEIEYLNVNLNGSRMAQFKTFSQQAPLEYSFVYDGKSVICNLKNTTSWAIEDAVIVIGTQYNEVGDLELGAEAEVSLMLDHLEHYTMGDDWICL